MLPWLPVAYRRLLIVLGVVFLLALPAACLVFKSRTRTADDYLREAKEHRTSGNAEQARLSTDKALDTAETSAERVAILESLLAEGQTEKPKTPDQALQNLLESTTTQMRILQEDPSNVAAGDAVAKLHLTMLRAVGGSFVGHDVIAHQMQRLLAARPRHLDAAEVLLRSQLAVWRQQGASELTSTVVRERLDLVRFVVRERLGIGMDLFFFLRQAAAAEEKSLALWATGSAAAMLKIEMIMERRTDKQSKQAALAMLEKKITGVFGSELVLRRCKLLQQLLRGWHHTATAALVEAGKHDPYAANWVSFALELVGARDEAYRHRAALARQRGNGLPARYQWRNLVGMLRHELRLQQKGLASQALSAIEVAGDNNPVDDVRRATELLELVRQARFGEKSTIRQRLRTLSAGSAGDLSKLCRASVLLELGDRKAALAMLAEVEVTREALAIWPGPAAGHRDAWALLRTRLQERLRQGGNAEADKLAQIILENNPVSRDWALLLYDLATAVDLDSLTFRLARLLSTSGRLDDLSRLLAVWREQPAAGDGRRVFELQLAMARNEADRVREQLAKLETDGAIDPLDA